MKEARVVSFSIFKGGTGKTTSAVNTAAALAKKGQRVLLIDLDQQASSTKYLGIDPDKNDINVYHCFIQNAPLGVATRKSGFGFDLVPSHELMAAVEAMLESGKDEGILREKVAAITPDYDFVLIDTPPGKAMLTFNAIVAADHILVPVAAERMAVDGLADLIGHLHSVLWRRFSLEQELSILFTMYKATTSHSPGIVQAAKRIYRDNVLSFVVPESVVFPRSFEKQQPLIHYSPTHKGAQAYHRLAKWLMHEKD
jgi:chromosome partitioning protein